MLQFQTIVRAALIAFPAIGLLSGLAAQFLGWGNWSNGIWAAATIPVLLVLFIQIIVSLWRGDIGLDIVAGLSMLATLGFGEYLAAVIVALMYAGGQYLESFAERRASRDMTALLARVPRSAMRYRGGELEEVGLDWVQPGDQLLVRQGDMVPVDGSVARGVAVLDESALTGESIPLQHKPGDPIISGSTNVGTPFDMLATRRAAESTYAGIVRLVEAAQGSRAPMSRLADRYAMLFLVLTIALAGAAWFWSGDPIRAVAVLVIATPCPLILAVPVALVAGLSRAAKHGILIKGGKAIEMLAQVRTLVIDKTGTLTHGRPTFVSTIRGADFTQDEVLRLAASLDQASQHVIATTIVDTARARGLALGLPNNVVETPGEGIEGTVDGQHVTVGGLRFVSRRIGGLTAPFFRSEKTPGSVAVGVALNGQPAGVIVLADELRIGTEALLRNLRAIGIERIVLATGDRQEVAAKVALGLSIDAVRSELTPDQKTLVVLSERKNGPVMMIGDGVNDAPALAAADLGLAMGARGAAASAEAADVVLLVDQLDRVLPAIRIARRSRSIAFQSVLAGIGLSVLGMVAASIGLLTPVQGALIQEGIDVAVIFNAVRALYGPPDEPLSQETPKT